MTRHRVYFITPVFLLSLLALVFAIAPTLVQASSGSFIGKFNAISKIVSTVPKNCDVNPYGVAVVRNSIGKLTLGNIPISIPSRFLCNDVLRPSAERVIQA
jgi:hypothetical protein